MSGKTKTTKHKKQQTSKKKEEKQPFFKSIYGLLAIIFLVAVIYSNTTAAPAAPIRRVVLSVLLLALWGYHFLYLKKPLLFHSKLVKWFLGLWICTWLWAFIGAFTTINVPEASLEIGQGLLTIVTIILAASTIQKKHFKLILKCLTILGLIQALVGILQVMGVTEADMNKAPYGFLFNRTFYGPFVAMLVPFSVALLFTGKTEWKVLGGLTFAAQAVVILLSQTRSAWVAVGVVYLLSHVLVILFRDRFAKDRIRLWWGINLGTVTLLVISFVLAWQLNIGGPRVQGTLERVTSLFGGGDSVSTASSTINERLLLWEQGLIMIKDSPIFGVGVGNWKLAAPPYLSEIPAVSYGDYFLLHPHNSWLQIGAEIGIPGLLFYIGAWGILFVLTFRLTKGTKDFMETIFYMALLGCITVFAVDMIFSFPDNHVGHVTLLAAAIGMIIGRYNQKSKNTSHTGQRINLPYWGSIGIAALLLINTVNAFGNFRFKQIWFKAYSATSSGQYEEVFKWADESKKYWQNLGPNTDPVELFTSLAYQNQKQFDKALDEIWIAQRHQPNSYRVYNAMGSVYTEMERFEEAEKIYLRCIKLTPQYRQVLKNMALNYFQWGKYSECVQVIEKMDLRGDVQLTYMLNESRRLIAR